MAEHKSRMTFRVRYSETDKMGGVYNARVLEWFELGRTEHLRELGVPYAEMESKGVFLPVIVAHVEYVGRASYDDLLEIETTASMPSKLRVRCDVRISHAEKGHDIAMGYTVHAVTDAAGKPTRPPEWFQLALQRTARS